MANSWEEDKAAVDGCIVVVKAGKRGTAGDISEGGGGGGGASTSSTSSAAAAVAGCSSLSRAAPGTVEEKGMMTQSESEVG